MKKQNRYPGIRPFTQDDDRLFFGRSESIKRINRMFKLERLMVLFGKSGLGKTSLVQAGAIPLLHKEDMKDGVEDLRFETVRFGAYDPEKDRAEKIGMRPVQRIRRAIEMEKGTEIPFPTSRLFDHVHDDGSPWLAAKDKQLSGDHRTIVLIIDQSEELFTWPKDDVDAVKYALRDLLNQNLPDHLEDDLRKAASKGSVDYGQLMSPPELKAMLIIRSDRLDELEQMTDVLPNIYNKRFELPALDRPSAREAIEEPANLEGNFSTPKFAYSEKGLTMILDFLCNKHKESDSSPARKNKKEQVEGFQLQMICQHVEKVVQQRVANGETDIVMECEDIGDLQDVTKTYYQAVLSGISDAKERDKVQVLVEEKLIYDAGTASRRLNEFDGVIMNAYQVSQDSLEYLHNSRLLRRMSLSEGGYIYEISHDSLMAPILEVKKARLEELERIQRREQEDREKEEKKIRDRIEREQREKKEAEARRKRRAGVLTAIATLGVIAIFGLGVSIVQTRNARLAEDEAKEAVADAKSANSELQSALNDLRKEEKLRVQLIKDLEQASSAADSSAAIARFQEKVAREEKARSEAISQKFFNSELDNRYGWIRSLPDLDHAGFFAESFKDWVSNDAPLDGANIVLPARLQQVMDFSEKSVAAGSANRMAGYHLAHQAHLAGEGYQQNLTTSLASLLASLQQYDIEYLAKPRYVGGIPTSVHTMGSQGDGQPILTLGFSDGHIAMVDGSMRPLWDAKDHLYRVGAMAYAPNGRFFATGSNDNTVVIYRTAGPRKVEILDQQNDYVRDLVFTDNGNSLLVASDDGRIHVYHLNEGSDSIQFVWDKALRGHLGYVYTLGLTKDENLMVSGGDNGEVIFWEKNRGVWNRRKKVLLGETRIRDLHVTKDTTYLIDGNNHLWKISNQASDTEGIFVTDELSRNEEGYIGKLVQISDNALTVVTGRNQLVLWDLTTQKRIGLIGGTDDLIVDVAYDPQEKSVFIAYGNGMVERVRFRKAKRPITDQHIMAGALPELTLKTKFDFGLVDNNEIYSYPLGDLATLYSEIANDTRSNETSSVEEEVYKKLVRTILKKYAGSGKAEISSDTEKTVRGIMESLLNSCYEEMNYSDLTIEEASMYQLTLEEGEPGIVSEWLTWAVLWKANRGVDEQTRRYIAKKAYEAIPGKVWEDIVSDEDKVSPDASIEFATDFNSVVPLPDSDIFLASFDVGEYTNGVGLFALNSAEEMTNLWELPPNYFGGSSVIWDCDVSPTGSNGVAVSEDGYVVLMSGLGDDQPTARRESFPHPFRTAAFISERDVILGTNQGMILHLDLGNDWVLDTIMADRGQVIALTRTSVGRWIAATTGGMLYSGNRNQILSGGALDLAEYVDSDEETAALTYSDATGTIYATFDRHLYTVKLAASGKLSQNPDVVPLNSLVTITALDFSDRRNIVIWGNKLGQIGIYHIEETGKSNLVTPTREEYIYGLTLDQSGRNIVTAAASNRLSMFGLSLLSRPRSNWMKEDREIRLDNRQTQDLYNRLAEIGADESLLPLISNSTTSNTGTLSPTNYR